MFHTETLFLENSVLVLKTQRLLNMESTNLAYWIGVAQTDGYFKKQYIKQKKLYRHQIRLNVGYCSIEMLEKFRRLSAEIFNVKGAIWYDTKRSAVEYTFGAKNLLPVFDQLEIDFSDPPKPPQWIIQHNAYFGAYLAGVIDGDGDVRIHRPSYPQCAIRITSGSPAIKLYNAIKKTMSIEASLYARITNSVYQGRKIEGNCYKIEFCVSPKNIDFFEKYIISHMAIERKRNKITGYIEKRAATENRTRIQGSTVPYSSR